MALRFSSPGSSSVARGLYLVGLAMLLLTETLFAASVQPGITLSADNTSVYLGDSIVIEVTSVALTEPADITPLFRHANLLRETTGARIAVIEGKVAEVRLRRMELVPRHEGQVVFGPLEGQTLGGSTSSNAITVTVLPPADSNWQPDESDLTVHMKLTSTLAEQQDSGPPPLVAHGYTGQHFVLDITLRHQHLIADETFTLPDFTDFDVLAEYTARRTFEKTTVPGGSDRWKLIAWRYHLFPRRAGSYRIDAPQWQGEAIRSRTQRARFVRTGDTVTLTATSPLSSEWWLPASALKLSEQWSDDARTLTAGDEIIRTLRIEARDVLASHLPLITPLESRSISATLLRQRRDQHIRDGHIHASAEFEYRMLAQSPVPVFLDTVRVPWYDTGSGEQREAIIPARRINVGLPEREDLLAELALDGQRHERWQLQAQALASRFGFWPVSLALLIFVVAVLLLLEMLHLYRRFRHRKTPRSVLPGL